MPRFMFGTNDPVEAHAIMALMNHAPMASAGPGQALIGGNATAPAMPPMPRPTALPAMPGPAAPPPPPQAAAPSANPRLENVVRLMDAYAKGGTPPNGVAGVRAVLTVLGISRAQDADEAQLQWLEQAFANPAWKPS